MKNMCRIQNKNGFTLIELTIIIGIIAILAAIAIPNYIGYRNKVYCKHAESDANVIATYLAEYFSIPANANYHKIPIGFTQTVIFPSSPENIVYTCNGTNTASVTEPEPGTYEIKVTDGSNRCPLEYRQMASDWGTTAQNGVYTKTVK